jgi:hypothetical protein
MQVEESIPKVADFRATISLVADSDVEVWSENFDFLNHPAAVVLSIWDRKQ